MYFHCIMLGMLSKLGKREKQPVLLKTCELGLSVILVYFQEIALFKCHNNEFCLFIVKQSSSLSLHTEKCVIVSAVFFFYY